MTKAAAFIVPFLLVSSARAQTPPLPADSRGDQRPTLPSLDPVPPPLLDASLSVGQLPSTSRRLSQGLSVTVTSYRVHGNTVFSAEELAQVTQPWVKANVTTEDLFAVRDAGNDALRPARLHQLRRNRPRSGRGGRLIELAVTEGRLTRIDVVGAKWFRPGYFKKRLSLDAELLNVSELERRLQLLQQAGRNRRLNATLRPGSGRGDSDLTLAVQERMPLTASIEFTQITRRRASAESAARYLSSTRA